MIYVMKVGKFIKVDQIIIHFIASTFIDSKTTIFKQIKENNKMQNIHKSIKRK